MSDEQRAMKAIQDHAGAVLAAIQCEGLQAWWGPDSDQMERLRAAHDHLVASLPEAREPYEWVHAAWPPLSKELIPRFALCEVIPTPTAEDPGGWAPEDIVATYDSIPPAATPPTATPSAPPVAVAPRMISESSDDDQCPDPVSAEVGRIAPTRFDPLDYLATDEDGKVTINASGPSADADGEPKCSNCGCGMGPGQEIHTAFNLGACYITAAPPAEDPGAECCRKQYPIRSGDGPWSCAFCRTPLPDYVPPVCTHEPRDSDDLCPAHGPFKCPDPPEGTR